MVLVDFGRTLVSVDLGRTLVYIVAVRTVEGHAPEAAQGLSPYCITFGAAYAYAGVVWPMHHLGASLTDFK